MSESLSVITGGKDVARGVEYHPPQEASRLSGGEGAPPTLQDSLDLHRLDGSSLSTLPHEARGIFVVGRRCDWISAGFKVMLDEHLLGRMYAQCEQWGRVAIHVDQVPFEARKMQSGKRLLLRNDDVAVVIDPEGAEGWTVQVDCPGSFMASHELDRAVDICRRIARGLGQVCGERLRRLDLCADIAGFVLGDVSAQNWVKPARARLERAEVGDVEKPWALPELRQYHRGERLTGFTICPGNALSAVIYDKREELETQRRPKKDYEEGIWRGNGWTDQAVTRVEFRFRSEALHELGCRDGLDRFRTKLDALWSYCSRMWLRLVLPWTASRLSRCALHPAWEVVRAVKFVHHVSPASRLRVRKGVSAGHALGAVLSLVGAVDHLARPVQVECSNGEVLRGADAAFRLSAVEASKLLQRRVRSVFARAAEVVTRELTEVLGEHKSAAFVLEREESTRARFGTFAASTMRPAESWWQPRLRRAA